MDNGHERTILQEGLIKITDRRLLVGTATYPMSDIKAANITRRAKNKKPLLLIIPAAVLITWSIIDQTGQFMELFNIGIALIVVSILLVLTAKPTYAVQIGSAAGNHSVLRSTDPNFVQRIVDAMNLVIARS